MEHVDVIIVGAGISGIGVAAHLRQRQPDRTFVMLEGRHAIGGTWDLFRYPGIRSDSDMYTFGYAFKPWVADRNLATAEAIRNYLHETVDEYNLEPHIRFHHRVLEAAWSSTERRWRLRVQRKDGGVVDLTCHFLVTGTGYYNYERGHTPDLPGLDTFEGQVIHPQHWPENLDYAGKRVLIVGSGATAVTLVPEMAKTAAHVTMLQRSPTFVISRPAQDPVAMWLKRWFPAGMAHTMVRTKNTVMGWLLYRLAQGIPERIRKYLLDQAREGTEGKVDVDVHFNPKYNPWDQRLCLIPEGDLFEALKSDRADIVTDTIERFGPTGVTLASGQTIDADIVVTATGLQLQFLGGIDMSIDGRPLDAADLVTYKGVMFGNVPNWMAVIGYTSASWTLKVDLAAIWLCRLFDHMERHGFDVATPRYTTGETQPYMAKLSSAGYIQRGLAQMPRQGTTAPWLNRDDYFGDVMSLRWGTIDDGVLAFKRVEDARPVAPGVTTSAGVRG